MFSLIIFFFPEDSYMQAFAVNTLSLIISTRAQMHSSYTILTRF